MRQTFDGSRDKQIANNAGESKALLCSAHGCPNLWSTSDGNLCRWHAAAEPHQWPAITQEAQHEITERARRAGSPKPVARPYTLAEKQEVLKELSDLARNMNSNPRAWLDRLRIREANGERMSPMQKHCLAQVKS